MPFGHWHAWVGPLGPTSQHEKALAFSGHTHKPTSPAQIPFRNLGHERIGPSAQSTCVGWPSAINPARFPKETEPKAHSQGPSGHTQPRPTGHNTATSNLRLHLRLLSLDWKSKLTQSEIVRSAHIGAFGPNWASLIKARPPWRPRLRVVGWP